LLGDLERFFAGLAARPLAGLAERGDRRRFGLGDRDADREGDRPRRGGDRLGGLLEPDRPRRGGDRLGGLLLRGGDLPLKPLGEGGRRLGGDLLQFPPLRLKGGGGGRLRGDDPRLPLGDKGLRTARVVKIKRVAIVLPSICPPSIAKSALSASSRFSNSTYAKPRGRSTFLSHATSTFFNGPNVPKISSRCSFVTLRVSLST